MYSNLARNGGADDNPEALPGGWPSDLVRIGSKRRHSRGAPLCEQRRAGSEVHLLLFGKVLRECIGSDGDRTIIDVHGRGDLIGVAGLLDGGDEPCTVRAHTRVATLSFDNSTFLRYLDRRPEARTIFHAQMARRIRHDTARAASLATERVEARIRRMLVDLGRRFGTTGDVRGLHLDLGMTRAELAGLAGTTLETVIRTAHRLRDQGLLVTDGRRFFIPDLELLRP